MATAANPSLFGMLGDEQYMQRQLEEQRAEAASKRSLGEQLNYMSSLSGQGLARGLAGAFGVETTDPTIRMASQLRGIASQFDTTTPEGIRKYAAAVKDINPNVALQASRMADEMDKAATDIRKTAAEASSKEGEVAGKASRIQMLKDAGLSEANAQAIASNDTAFANYVKGKNVETPTDYAVAAGALKFGVKPYLGEYTAEQIATMDKYIQTNKVNVAQATAQKPVDVAAIIKEVGTQKDVEGKAATWKKAGEAYTAQVPMLNKLDEVVTALPQSYTGSFADASLQFGKALSAVGIPVDEKKLSNTEYVNSVSAQVLQTIARSFPGSLAVKEMEQLVKSKFNAKQQLETMTRIIRDLRTEIQSGVLSYEQLSKLPEQERYNKDMNLLTGTNYKKLSRLNTLMDKHRSGTISKEETKEAQQLQQELK